ncbi:unnamed protein product [Blepharisma stoltei]|uniref:Uncharacterized protein n=1 Tax=Blepharisma stoltei TaxID=1481888 RepID=A0AAU9JM12_9CILI|nr:unnamed protein product [Blepharisma stoltei]
MENKEIIIRFIAVGIRSFICMPPYFFHSSDCYILVFDIASRESFDHLEEIKKRLLAYLNIEPNEDFPFVVIGNKTNMVREVPYEMAKEWCRKSGNISVFESSANDYINIATAFEMAAKKGEEWHIKKWFENCIKKSKN